jgi:hypothetical protein
MDAMTSLEYVTLEVDDHPGRRALLHLRFRFGVSSAPAGLEGADERLSRLHAISRGVPARHGRRVCPGRTRRRGHVAEAGR